MKPFAAIVVISLLLLGSCTGSEEDPPVRALDPCDVLTLSESTVSPGQQVRVEYRPPARHTWGVVTELWRMVPDDRRVAFVTGTPNEGRFRTSWPQPLNVFHTIGFQGEATGDWKVPQRLAPGPYELRKESSGPVDAGGCRRKKLIARVSFEVTGQTEVPSASTWQAPPHYRFRFQSSCGEMSFIGLFKVVVRDGRAMMAKGFDQSSRASLRGRPLHEVPTLEDLLDQAVEAGSGGADHVEVATDPSTGHPILIEIDYLEQAIDDEACYDITGYKEI